MFWALCADTHRGGVQPLCSSAPEPGVESLPLPEQPLFWCIFSVFAPTTAYAVPLPRSRRGGFSFTARQLLAPMRRMRAAAKSRRSAKGYGILASPADAGEVPNAVRQWGAPVTHATFYRKNLSTLQSK